MESNFSSALQLTDLNDFITPSQECIKPVQMKKTSKRKGLSKIQIATDGNYMEVDTKTGKSTKLQKAEITLNDCLACSGCITSAETVLVAMQSHEEFSRVLEENQKATDEQKKIIVVSVSPQARASLAAKHGMDAKDAAAALDIYFKSLGANIVLDTTYARELVLLQSAMEFLDRYKAKDDEPKSLPMLTSSCPGWICYAEKTHGDFILPHLSSVKSPQQVNGTLIQEIVSKRFSKTPNKCYHVAIMPCYDKKLEASRQDFYDDIYSTRDVDLVLTSSEVQVMLESNDTDLKGIMQEKVMENEDLFSTIPELEAAYLNNKDLLNHAGGGSGGYLEHVFLTAAESLFGKTVNEIKYKAVRGNKDFRDFTLLGDDGKVILHFAAAYGFRSIQNLVQKMKRGKCPYHFVEVMACPSGCLNGGGQIKADVNDREEQKKLLSKVEEIYNQVPCVLPGDNPTTKQTLYSLSNDSEHSKKLLRTQYHAVEKDESLSLMVKW